jgi:hypothetical protein
MEKNDNPLRVAIDLITGQCFDETVDLIRTKLDQPDLAPSDINPNLFAAVMATRLDAMKATGTLPVHFRDALARATSQAETKGGQV